MKFSELFELEHKEKSAYLLGLVYSWPMISKNNDIILAYSSYKLGDRSKNHFDSLSLFFNKHKNKLIEFLGNDFDISLNKNIDYKFNKTKGSGVSVVFEFDNINKNELYLYGQIEKWLKNQNQKTKECFLIGVLDGRGSLDFNHNFITLDADKQESPEVVKRKLILYSDILGLIYNYNPRILQLKSRQKNDQFRINLDYFMGHFGLFNPFKVEYYCNEKDLIIGDDLFFKDFNFINAGLNLKNNNNQEINNFAIELSNKDLTEVEKQQLIKNYRESYFSDSDSDDEVKNASINVKNLAKKNANYQCEYDETHATFTAKNNNQYVEGHHLIPFATRNDFAVNIDVVDNIVALCPNCHRQVHNAIDKERNGIIENLFNKRSQKLIENGIDLNLKKLKQYYT